MRNTREGLRSLGLIALAFTTACSNNTSSGPSFAFQRPEAVELACIDLSKGNENASPLPLRCCAPTAAEEPLAPPELVQKNCRPDARPVLHALVTQTVRGEVAAVDLEAQRVLDSDQQIPGFTFVDVGGLPTAVVVPPERPTPGFDPEFPEGPPWTYIASADEQAVRAVATCRFRTGVACGPELLIASRLTRVPVDGAPRDMLFGPDEALWLTLPDLGLLARVQVGAAKDVLADGGVGADAGGGEEPDSPFLMVGAGENAVPAVPQYFRVPGNQIARAEALTTDAPAYVAACGLGYAFEPRPAELPRAPEAVVEGTPASQPTRMRYDALSGLLFVSDRVMPVLHVFSLGVDGSLVTRGAVPMGAPVRDFAFTAYVPETVDIFSQEPISSEATDQKRYLYALDDRDGSLMQFALETGADGAKVTPLAPPMPVRYRDRSLMFGVGSVLEVVDTRGLSPETCGAGVEPKNKNTIARQLEIQLTSNAREIAATEQKRADARVAGAEQEEIDQLSIELDTLRTERPKLQRRYDIAAAAGPTTLRGVFLMVVSLAGEVGVLDILDLDVPCRARTSCVDEDGDEKPLRTTQAQLLDKSTPVPLAVQRNALRLLAGREPTVAVSPTTAFVEPDCTTPSLGDDGSTWSPYVAAAGGTNICVPPDPWNQQDNQWSIEEDRVLPGLAFTSGYVTRVAASDLEADTGNVDADAGVAGGDESDDLAPLDQMLWVHAPQGTNLCTRGAQDGVGDQVLIQGAPASNPSTCTAPVSGDQPALKIIRAYDDRLLVRALGRTEGSVIDDELKTRDERNADAAYAQRAAAEAAKIIECYPEFVGFQLRVGDERVNAAGAGVGSNEEAVEVRKVLLVLGSTTGFLSRMKTDEGGRCVLDPEKDPRFRARTVRGRPFQNTSLAFTLATDLNRTSAVIGTVGGRTILSSSVVPQNDYPDALPKSIRFFPTTNDLFVVDSANQGLKRFTLNPFGRDTTAVYR